MGYQWLGRMPYLSKTRHGIFRYRRAIPPSLREAAGQSEWIRSLQTKDPQEAKKRWAVANLEFEQYQEDLESLSNSQGAQAPENAQERIGAAFLRKHKLANVTREELMEEHEKLLSRRGTTPPSEFEQRLALIEDELGINNTLLHKLKSVHQTGGTPVRECLKSFRRDPDRRRPSVPSVTQATYANYELLNLLLAASCANQ